MTQHAKYKYSVTVYSDDLALIFCLRALSQYAQETGNARIPWGGTKKEDWEQDGHSVTFHFSDPSYREAFLKDAQRLLPQRLWQKARQSDSDPTVPQN